MISESNKNLLSWSLDETGCLTVFGSGRLPDFSCGENPVPPWYEEREQIRELHISEGVTEIGMKSFDGCSELKKVYLPETLQRVHAYAFENCRSLEEVNTKREQFLYVYDEYACDSPKTVWFGMEAFKNTPWAIGRWGDFYCEEGVLYTCFAEKSHLEVPEGVHTLGKFAFYDLWETRSVTLPKTLTEIREFAFSNSGMKELVLPESVETISRYAFADSSLELIEFPDTMEKTEIFARTCIMTCPDDEEEERKGGKKRKKRLRRVPELYKVQLKADRGYGKFKRMEVVKKQAEQKKDGTIKGVYGKTYIDVGEIMYRKIKRGGIPICINWSGNRLICVKSFSWDSYYNLVDEYLLYPVLEDEGIEPWRDSFTYQEMEDITTAFWDCDGEKLAREGCLRMSGKDEEEWFWSSDSGNFGGPLELELLEYWMKKHPWIKIDSISENEENDHRRIFVSV